MPDIQIEIDTAGWQPSAGTQSGVSAIALTPITTVVTGRNVTRDELSVGVLRGQVTLPGTIEQWRHLFQVFLRTNSLVSSPHAVAGGLPVQPLTGALISCNWVAVEASAPAVKCVAKLRARSNGPVTYLSVLWLPIPHAHVLEISVRAVERAGAGVREAVVQQELCRRAGPAEWAQIWNNTWPVEWKFNRSHQDQQREFTSVIADEERFDALFIDHPLSRVRRLMKRIERFLKVAVSEDATSNSISVRFAPVKKMGVQEMTAELGPQPVTDELMVLAIQKIGLPVPTFEERQEQAENRMKAALEKTLETHRGTAAATAFGAGSLWTGAEIAALLESIRTGSVIDTTDRHDGVDRVASSAAEIPSPTAGEDRRKSRSPVATRTTEHGRA